LWDLPAARRQAQSTLPNRARAHPFFDFRYGYILGPDDLVIAGLPQRLQLIDASNSELAVIGEISSNRNERDPISVWRSMDDDLLYIRPINGNSFFQIDPSDGKTFEFYPGREVSSPAQIESFNALRLSNQARIIGDPLATTTVPLLDLLLGEDYLRLWNYQPVTIMLLDILVPVTPAAQESAVLIYVFDEARGVGSVDLIRLPGVMQMTLHPDNRRLVLRRSSGQQPIEIYDLNTGLLERTIYPAIQDPAGNHLFALTKDGGEILSDFERFATDSGETLQQDLTLSVGFSDYAFSQDGERLITLRGNEWWVWDIKSSTVIRKETIRLRGNVVDVSPDADRYLTQRQSGDQLIMEITDIGSELRKSVGIDTLGGRLIDVSASPDWSRFLAIYQNGDVAIYDLEAGRLQYIAYDDLPVSGSRSYGWIDNDSAYVMSQGGGGPGVRLYGADYHVTGLPNCIVEAYPDTWEELLPLWERFSVNLGGERLTRLALTICNNLPETTGALVESLTPTPGPRYVVAATRPAYAVAGAPYCLTSSFEGDALAYANLWRDISAGLEGQDLEELEEMLCEGLIGSLRGVVSTATPDPLDVAVELTSTAQALRDNPPTPTLGPDQTGSNITVMLIDAESGIRSLGRFLPPQPEPPTLNLVADAFSAQTGYRLQNLVMSEDGQLIAGLNPENFLVVYRMNHLYTTIAAYATATIEARRTGEAPRIALRPTNTPTFSVIGTARPTITPTITPTIPPPVNTLFGDPSAVTDICEATTIYSLNNAPSNFAPTGTLLIQMPESRTPWRLNPANGDLHPDERVPSCVANGNCNLSMNHEWILQTGDDIAVLRVDGSDRRTLFQTYEAPVFPQQIYWTPDNQVEYTYQGYVDNLPATLYRRYDPDTGVLSEPFQNPELFSINELGTQVVAAQPNRGPLALARTSFDAGYKYYIYDRETGNADFFTRVYLDKGDLNAEWNPTGDYLYYHLPDVEGWYVYDAARREHFRLEALPRGLWSNDSHFRAAWLEPNFNEWEGGQIPKLSIWDSVANATRRYCLPETGFASFTNAPMLWSPDGRYISFRAQPVPQGDAPLTPTAVTTATPTPLPTLEPEAQRDQAFYRIYIIDLETGAVVEISDEEGQLLLWISEEDDQ
jgi:hypothetical protein